MRGQRFKLGNGTVCERGTAVQYVVDPWVQQQFYLHFNHQYSRYSCTGKEVDLWLFKKPVVSQHQIVHDGIRRRKHNGMIARKIFHKNIRPCQIGLSVRYRI